MSTVCEEPKTTSSLQESCNKISVVTTLYNSQEFISEFYERCIKTLQKMDCKYEIIFVDDGSKDNSLMKAKKIAQKDPHVVVIELSRNFGHHRAMLTGIKYAKGDFAFVIDSDLEESPELLLDFFEKLKNQNCDVVYGVQNKRKGKLVENYLGSLFYTLFRTMTKVDLPRNVSTIRLMNKNYYQALNSYSERVVFMHGIWADMGFNQQSFYFDKQAKGSTEYTFSKRLSLVVNSITSFSTKPLKFICYLGFITTGISFLIVLDLIINKLFLRISVSGWTSLMVSIWFIGGLILSSLGIIGIYISKIFEEVKSRPFSIIKNIDRRTKD